MKTCPYCNSQMDDDNLFCENCGKKYPQGKICPQCGVELNENDLFCQNCGTKVELTTPSSSEPSSSVEEVLQKKCPNCGTIITDNCLFCENCGTKLHGEISKPKVTQTVFEEKNVVEEKPQAPAPANPTTIRQDENNKKQGKKPSGNNMMFPILIGVIVLVLLGGGAWYYLNNKTKSSSIEIEKIVINEQNGSSPMDDGFYYLNAGIDYPKGKSKAETKIKEWIKGVVTLTPCTDVKIIYNEDVNKSNKLMDALIGHCKSHMGTIHSITIEKIFENDTYITIKSTNMYSGGNSGYYHNNIATFKKTDGTKLKIADIFDLNNSNISRTIGFVPSENNYSIGLTDDKVIIVGTDESYGYPDTETELPISKMQKLIKSDSEWIKVNVSQSKSEESIIRERIEDIYDKIFKYLNSSDYIPNFEDQFLSSEFNALYNEAGELAENLNDDYILMDSNMWSGQDFDNPSIEVVNVYIISDNKATVEILYKPFYNMDDKEQRTLSLVKENEKWVIDDFKEEPYYSSVKNYLKEQIETLDYSSDYDWIQGHWVCDGPLGKTHLVIDEDHIMQYQKSPSESTNPTFTIEDNVIVANSPIMQTTYNIDVVNHRIQYGEMNGKEYWFRKISDSSSTDYATQISNEDYSTYASNTKEFTNDQYVLASLANHSFKHNDGLVIRFDSQCQVYIDGDWVAGATSVVQYDKTSALIEFNSPTYGANRLLVKIVKDKLELVDTKDHSVYRQYM